MAEFPKIKVLHVEDDPYVRECTAVVLKRAGYDVESAANGKAAWEVLAPDLAVYQIVITDAHMPMMNGWELVRLLRDREFQGRIVVYSTYDDEAVATEFKALGAHAVVHKSASPDELLSTMRRLTN